MSSLLNHLGYAGKYNPKLVQNSYISLNIRRRGILKLTSAQSFHSADVWLELLWFWAKEWGEKKRAAANPLTIIYFFLFFTMLKCCKTWTIYINFLTYISWRIKKFIYLCIAVNLVCVYIYMSLDFKFIYNALLQKCEPLFPSLAVLWNKSSAVSLSVKLPFFENLNVVQFFS